MTLAMCRIGVIANPALMVWQAWEHDVFWLCWGAVGFACCLLAVLADVYAHGASDAERHGVSTRA